MLGEHVQVIFCDLDPLDEGTRWRHRAVHWMLNKCLKPGFRHCFVMRRAESFDGWLILNVTAERFELIEIPQRERTRVPGDPPVEFEHYGAMVAWMVETGQVRMITTARQPVHDFHARGPLSCVSVVKSYLGVVAPHVWTPHQLFQHLSREDGE